ncbi:PREDICTED: uncharacterized protein LOC108532417 isoform X1 [Rhinopithecus bieti]|uniref:uncharacterized protein LOC108532417 isoform X1 n=1 Tax=Rhinopithecus bieti TaxID=61621 RepID=UPI00083BC73E|nr:PREDICTED: uncharacterized protein LOC108532417 isoform X1 [Rhinopithecus bieti]
MDVEESRRGLCLPAGVILTVHATYSFKLRTTHHAHPGAEGLDHHLRPSRLSAVYCLGVAAAMARKVLHPPTWAGAGSAPATGTLSSWLSRRFGQEPQQALLGPAGVRPGPCLVPHLSRTAAAGRPDPT